MHTGRWEQCGGRLDVVARFQVFRSFVRANYPSGAAWNQSKARVADAIFEKVNDRVLPVTLAALAGWEDSVETFVKLGGHGSLAVSRTCGPKAVTPLLVSVLQNELTFAAKLMDLGAEINGEGDGINPLSMAIQVSHSSRP
jgi:hypothetical protein